MDPRAERHVLPGIGAVEAQLGGIGTELGGVAVGGAEAGHDQVTGGDGHALDLQRLQGDAAGELHRAVEAQELLDGVGVEGRVVDQAAKLIGVVEQGVHAVADEVHRGLVAGEEQEHHVLQQLRVGELLAVLFGMDHGGEDVVVVSGALPRDGFGDDAAHVERGLDDLVGVLHGQQRVEHLGDGVAPGAELDGVATLGHAEHLVDDGEGEGEGQLADEVDGLAALGEVVEDAVDQIAGGGPDALDGPGRERLRHQLADARVVGWVDVQDGEAALEGRLALLDAAFVHLLAAGGAADIDVALLDAGPGLAEEGVDVGPAGDEPGTERGLADGVRLADGRVLCVRIVVEPRLERVQADDGRRCRVAHALTIPCSGQLLQ